MSLLNCTLAGGKFISLKESTLKYQEMYSMLLTAYMAKHAVRARINEGSANCDLSYVWYSDNNLP